MTSAETAQDQVAEVRRLHRERSRRPFVTWSAIALAALVVQAWSSPALWPADRFNARRLANFQRFLGELWPYPLQGKPFDLGIALGWITEILVEKGLDAAGITLAISIAAAVLAALGAAVFTLPATRTVTTAEPFLPGPQRPSGIRRAAWTGIVVTVRALLVFLRAVPEYVWAFLFLAMLGPTAWPLVLALALHNIGILGKLSAEVVENLDPAPMRALRGLGAGRLQIAAAALFPQALPRFLLFFFYRWETCVREATVLGMLGIASLGAWIVDTRARNHYDEMLVFVLLGAALVLVGDIASAVAREVIRRTA